MDEKPLVKCTAAMVQWHTIIPISMQIRHRRISTFRPVSGLWERRGWQPISGNTLYTQGTRRFWKKTSRSFKPAWTFFQEFLVRAEDGTLITSPSVSPENTYIMKNGARGCLCEGAVMDMEILTELLQDYIKACKVLGKKPELKKKGRDNPGRTSIIENREIWTAAGMAGGL